MLKSGVGTDFWTGGVFNILGVVFINLDLPVSGLNIEYRGRGRLDIRVTLRHAWLLTVLFHRAKCYVWHLLYTSTQTIKQWPKMGFVYFKSTFQQLNDDWWSLFWKPLYLAGSVREFRTSQLPTNAVQFALNFFSSLINAVLFFNGTSASRTCYFSPRLDMATSVFALGWPHFTVVVHLNRWHTCKGSWWQTRCHL